MDVRAGFLTAVSPRATIALQSVLARHNLIDAIPTVIDLAIPRGSWTPGMTMPVRWHHFTLESFDIGRDTFDAGAGRSIGIYLAECSIIDAFRLRHLAGGEIANQALKRWLRQGGQPSKLLRMARSSPRAAHSVGDLAVSAVTRGSPTTTWSPKAIGTLPAPL